MTVFADTTSANQDSVLYDVNVETGKVTDLGEIWLKKN